jgi:hypothetical protein
MKKLNRITVLWIILILSVSCTSQNALDYTQNIKQIKGELLLVDCFVASPYSITCVDTLLIFYDRYEGKMITLLDLQNGRCAGRFVSEGNGPEEMIAPVDILSFPQKDELYTYQRNTACLNTLSMPDMQMQTKILFQERPPKIHKMQDYYVGEGIYKNGRFGIYDKQGKLLRAEGAYPFRAEAMEPASAFILYQGQFCSNPQGNYFAIGCQFCSHLSFYEVKENETILLKEYASDNIKAKYAGQLAFDDDCIISYTGKYATDKYCYMLYSGKTYSENNQRTDWGSYIIVFDWEGNYIETLETNQEIRTFCIDETNNIIYAVTIADFTGEYGIMRFKI